jgi:transcriptional regulator of heat shock response
MKYSPCRHLETLYFEAATTVSEMRQCAIFLESCNFLVYQLRKSEISHWYSSKYNFRYPILTSGPRELASESSASMNVRKCLSDERLRDSQELCCMESVNVMRTRQRTQINEESSASTIRPSSIFCSH